MNGPTMLLEHHNEPHFFDPHGDVNTAATKVSNVSYLDSDDDSSSGWDPEDENGNYLSTCDEDNDGMFSCHDDGNHNELLLGFFDPEDGCSLSVEKATGETETEMDTIAIIEDDTSILASYSYPRPTFAPFKSPMLQWPNVVFFYPWLGPERIVQNVLQREKPMASVSFRDQFEFQAVLEKVTASGFPLTTQPDKRMITIAQPIKLGEAIHLEGWLQSFTVANPYGTGEIHLLSHEDQQRLLLLRNNPLSHWLDFLAQHSATTTCSPSDLALLHLLMGYPIECTLSALWKLSKSGVSTPNK
jgi:hypothetical protein